MIINRLGKFRLGTITHFVVVAFTTTIMLAGIAPAGADDEARSQKRLKPKLLDLSGLVWIEGDVFLAVSDAKYPDEDKLTRISLLTLPHSLDGIGFHPMSPQFPGDLSSDFESASGIPGTKKFLLVESTSDGGPYQRIFLAMTTGKQTKEKKVKILGQVEWGSFTVVTNIEATAVAKTDTGSGLIFIWAERASGQQFTDIKWTRLQLDPFAIGGTGIKTVPFTLPSSLTTAAGTPLYNRSIVGMDLDSEGNIYTVASYDPEGHSDNPDIGPFRSAVLKIGKVIAGNVVLDAEPTVQAHVHGFKVESVAVRGNGDDLELFIGTDDEDYGGTLRVLPPR